MLTITIRAGERSSYNDVDRIDRSDVQSHQEEIILLLFFFLFV